MIFLDEGGFSDSHFSTVLTAKAPLFESDKGFVSCCLQIRDFRRFLEVVFGHLPINLQGYNYGLTYFAYPWLGSLAMFVFCFSLGVLLSWVMEKTNSIWAPALLHGAVNAIVGVGLLFQLPTEKALALRILGPTPTGLLAVLPFLCLALAILQKEKRETHEFY